MIDIQTTAIRTKKHIIVRAEARGENLYFLSRKELTGQNRQVNTQETIAIRINLLNAKEHARSKIRVPIKAIKNLLKEVVPPSFNLENMEFVS